MEPLERRALLADVSLAALFGGSIIFSRSDGDQNRLHAVLNVDAQAGNGALSGRLTIDGLGKFQFTGSASNDVAFIVFQGDNGSGSIVAAETDDGNLRGELNANIDSVATSGIVRLRDNGGVPASTDAEPLDVSSNVATTEYGGTAHFRGESDDDRHSAHAVLHLGPDDASGLLVGSFRINSVGRFQVVGFSFGDERTLIFTSGASSGAMAVSGSNDLTGKFFAQISGSDRHGTLRFHRNGGRGFDPSGEATVSTIDVGGPPLFGVGTTTPDQTPVTSIDDVFDGTGDSMVTFPTFVPSMQTDTDFMTGLTQPMISPFFGGLTQ